MKKTVSVILSGLLLLLGALVWSFSGKSRSGFQNPVPPMPRPAPSPVPPMPGIPQPSMMGVQPPMMGGQQTIPVIVNGTPVPPQMGAMPPVATAPQMMAPPAMTPPAMAPPARAPVVAPPAPTPTPVVSPFQDFSNNSEPVGMENNEMAGGYASYPF